VLGLAQGRAQGLGKYRLPGPEHLGCAQKLVNALRLATVQYYQNSAFP
jgi:hypothetical protein